jgi:catechol 2,3-dioxygenase-like lactoylglutathione lyase family enzyme
MNLDHFNVPVRDLNVARRFYCEVLGGEVVMEASWRRHDGGWARGAHVDIQLFDGEGHMNAYWQPWGQPAPDQLFPHRAFRIASAEKLDELLTRLKRSGVPYVLVTREAAGPGALVPVAAYLRDPDGNQLELRCEAYPFRSDIHVGAFDTTVQYYPWREWRALVPDGGSPDGEGY